jgi:hypothetical protein
MAAWRLYLTDRLIRRLEILEGKPSTLCVWMQPERVVFLDLQNGNHLGERAFEDDAVRAPRASAEWRDFVSSLTGPAGQHLPLVRASGAEIHSTADGKQRLYRIGASDLSFEVDDAETRLELGADVDIAALRLDPASGALVILDWAGKLHLFKGQVRVGIVETGLDLHPEMRPELALAGGAIFASDGQQILKFDAAGVRVGQLDVHYTLGALALSPDGRFLATSDLETGVLRVYSGADLKATHQRFATDLMAEARRVQLVPGSMSPSAAVGALALSSKGTLAFSVSGLVCVTSLSRMKRVPRAKPSK